MRKILITNDDGIMSDGLIRLAGTAVKYGEVWVVAPEKQCSAMSHCITLREPIEYYPVDFPVDGVHAFAITGTPADCVRVGIPNIMKCRPDVVFAGINYGHNIGSDIQYSATCGAAFEATWVGIQAIAFSEGMCDMHEVTDVYLDKIMGELLKEPLSYNLIWNVNFPSCPISEYKGILRDRTVAHNSFFHDSYPELERLDNGRVRVLVHGDRVTDAKEGTDFEAISQNYISIGTVSNYRE